MIPEFNKRYKVPPSHPVFVPSIPEKVEDKAKYLLKRKKELRRGHWQ